MRAVFREFVQGPIQMRRCCLNNSSEYLQVLFHDAGEQIVRAGIPDLQGDRRPVERGGKWRQRHPGIIEAKPRRNRISFTEKQIEKLRDKGISGTESSLPGMQKVYSGRI